MISDTGERILVEQTVLVPVENVVREFFATQFLEAPRLLRSSYVDGSVHVHGYRPVPPSEMRLLTNPAMRFELKRYYEQLFQTTRQSLKQLLSRSLGRNVSEVECVFDPAQHEFDIVVTLCSDESTP